jgi:hypothetical protein
MKLPILRKTKIYLSSIWFLWLVCLFLNIITFLFLYFKIHPGSKTFALHYNVLVGVEWYGAGRNLYLIPGAAVIILAANFILYWKLKDSQSFLASLTVFVSFCVQIIMLVSALFLAKVN